MALTPRARSFSPAASINSPQLLMLSGIGDPEELRAVGIAVRVALQASARNLQDHISAAMA